MIVSVITQDDSELDQLSGRLIVKQLNHILQLVATAYSDDPGTSDLDDEQPVYPVNWTNAW